MILKVTLTTLLLILIYSNANAIGGIETLLIENRSAYDIKLVAPGKAVIVSHGVPATTHQFDRSDPLGVQLNIWWKHNPRELCRLFTPWSRRVLITGKHTIACLSKNL